MSGFGAVSPFGAGREALRHGVVEGASGLAVVRRFDTSGFSTTLAALVPGHDTFIPPTKPGPGQRLMVEFAVAAIREALEHAGRSGAGVGLVLGTNVEDRPRPYDALLVDIAAQTGIDGPCLTTSIACASAASAIGLAAGLLERGDVDCVVAGGSDAITPWVMGGFDVVGVLKASPATPFGAEPGLSLGEGAAFFVLERLETAQARGATVHARLTGFGLAADGHHATAPAPDGRGVSAALRRLGPVVYINAHGSGTAANDVAEANGIEEVASTVPVSSAKGLLGHAQGAAAGLEILATLFCRERGVLPPTWGTRRPLRPGAPTQTVLEEAAFPAGAWGALSAAFGGANVALRFGGEPGLAANRPVYLGGLSAVGPHGVGLEGLLAGWDHGGAPDRALDSLCRQADLSRESPLARMTALVGLATLRAAGVRPSRANRGGLGLVLGERSTSPSTAADLETQLEGGGIQAFTFARVSPVAPAGLASRVVGLRGPLDVVCAGPLSFLAALVHAVTLCRTMPGVEGMLALEALESARWTGGLGVFVTVEPQAIEIVDVAMLAPGAALPERFAGVPRTLIDAEQAGPSALLALQAEREQVVQASVPGIATFVIHTRRSP